MYEIKIDTSEVKQLISDWRSVPSRFMKRVRVRIKNMGEQGVKSMRRVTRKNRYTGDFEESIGYDLIDNDTTVVIGPNKKLKQYDAGIILQNGARPIPNAPWRPIVQWAIWKGFDNPYALWKKIQREGITAYPFIENTFNDSSFQKELKKLEAALGEDLQREIILKTNNIGSYTDTKYV